MTNSRLPLELNSDLLNTSIEAELYAEAESRLNDLAAGHDDLTGAAISIRAPQKGKSPPAFKVTVVVYARPDNIAASWTTPEVFPALKSALDAVERQVRKKRNRLREHWKKPSATQPDQGA